jgi:hypothetical protein
VFRPMEKNGVADDVIFDLFTALLALKKIIVELVGTAIVFGI